MPQVLQSSDDEETATVAGAGAGGSGRGGGASTKKGNKGKESFPEWPTKSAQARYALNMPADATPWTGTHRLGGVPHTPRFVD